MILISDHDHNDEKMVQQTWIWTKLSSTSSRFDDDGNHYHHHHQFCAQSLLPSWWNTIQRTVIYFLCFATISTTITSTTTTTTTTTLLVCCSIDNVQQNTSIQDATMIINASFGQPTMATTTKIQQQQKQQIQQSNNNNINKNSNNNNKKRDLEILDESNNSKYYLHHHNQDDHFSTNQANNNNNNNNNNHNHHHGSNNDNENDPNGNTSITSIQTANNEQPFATFVYTALINDKVQLPCDIQPPTSDDQIVLVLWYKDDQLAPILTLDGRKNQLDPGAVQVSSSTLRGRAYFNVHGRPAHLSIDPVAASDEGDYRCRVDFRKARTINTIISLKVIIPPQVPKITDQDGNYLNGLVGPYNEGDELTLTCLTKGGKPRPSLIWWRDYAIIDDSFEFDDRDVTTNELVITRLSRHHLLTILMCQAINSNITGPASSSITLDLNLKPSEVRITQLTPILVAGSDALFECNTYGSRPMPIIYWLFDGNRYDTRIHGEQQTGSTITLRLERRHRGMVLECITENLRIPNSAIRDQLTIDVQYPPQMELKLGAPSLSLDAIQEGIDIYFDCHVDSNPAPTTPITWLFNGEPLQPEPGVIESNQSLVLQRVPRWRNGTYQCKCSNQQGTMISNQIQLEIKFAPVCQIPYTLIYGLQLQEIIQIGCEVHARPADDVSFQWRFEKHTNLANFIVINKTKSILEYVPRTREQYGLIECVAKNSIGIQREPCRYLIVPFAQPLFPYDCMVSNQSDSTLSIRCDGSLFGATNNASSSSSLNEEFKLVKHYDGDDQSGPSSGDDLNEDVGYGNVDDVEENEVGRSISLSSSGRLTNKQNGQSEQHSPSIDQTIMSNMTTSDIYSMYFAPDLNQQPTEFGADQQEDKQQQQQQQQQQQLDNGQSIKMTYRNGVGPFPSITNQNGLRSAASMLFLNELVGKFNSHQLNQQPHLLVYPPTYYICEIFSLSPKPMLIKNVTINAVEKRIMNPLNGSFSFLIDDLPPNTPLRVNIYAQNNRKQRSPMRIELDAKTLRAAERRIDYEGHNSDNNGHARGRKSSFFEELYGGYGRFRNKHMVVGFMISTVAVTVIIAIILITVAIMRSKHGLQPNHQQQQQESTAFHNNRELIMLDDKLQKLEHQPQQLNTNNNQRIGESFKRKNTTLSRSNQSLNSRKLDPTITTATIMNESVLETTFLTNDDDPMMLDDQANHQMDLIEFSNNTISSVAGNGGYGMDLLGDDDSSIRSDNQLIQTTTNANNNTKNSNYGKALLLKKHQRTAAVAAAQVSAPPNYYDLNLHHNHHRTPPDLIQTVMYHHQGSHPTDPTTIIQQSQHHLPSMMGNPEFFDTISFGANNGNIDVNDINIKNSYNTAEMIKDGCNTNDKNSTAATMMVSSDQVSGNIIHISPTRKYSFTNAGSGNCSSPRSIIISSSDAASYGGQGLPSSSSSSSRTSTLLRSSYNHHHHHHHYQPISPHVQLPPPAPSSSSCSSSSNDPNIFGTLPRSSASTIQNGHQPQSYIFVPTNPSATLASMNPGHAHHHALHQHQMIAAISSSAAQASCQYSTITTTTTTTTAPIAAPTINANPS